METQVAIVGGGPVGLALAIELAQRDIQSVVVEKEQSLHRIPKGQNLTQRTMEHFRTWGIEDQVRDSRIMPPGYPAAGINAYGNLMSEYAHPWFARSHVSQYYFAENERIPQYLTEKILRERVSELDAATATYGIAATDVVQGDEHMAVVTDHSTIDAEYVVGCDGSRSVVRRALGIEETISDHDRRMVLLVFRSSELHRILDDRFGEAAFFNVLHPDLDGYWRFLGRVDIGESWFFHAPVLFESTVDGLDYPALLRETVGAEFDVDLDYIGFWDLRVAIANTYRTGRGFIAGDAAHSHPPYGGYGINTGFEDARNLGWKLAAELGGWAGEGLLDSYSAERRPVFESTARDFIERFIERDRRFISRFDPRRDHDEFAAAWEARRQRSDSGVTDFAPHYEGSAIVAGPEGAVSSAAGSHEFKARPGHHLPPIPGSPVDAQLEGLGSGFALINAAGDELADRFTRSADELGVPLKLASSSPNPSTSYSAASVLVRPDHFVSWVDDGRHFEAGDVLLRSIGS